MMVDRKAFLAAIKLVSKVVRRAGIPALSGVLLTKKAGGDIRVQATDLETSMETYVPSDEPDEFNVLVPAKTLQTTLAAIKTECVSLYTDSTRFVLGDATIPLLVAKDFPVLTHADRLVAEVGVESLQDGFSRIHTHASKDEARPILTGVALQRDTNGQLVAVATDSYRLGVVEFYRSELAESDWMGGPTRRGGPPAPLSRLVSGYVVKNIAIFTKHKVGVARIFVTQGEGSITFRLPGVTVTTRQIPGEFPNWRQLLPEGSGNVLTYDPDELGEVLTMAAGVSDDGVTVPVVFELDGTVKVRRTSQAQSFETVLHRSTYRGEALNVGVNPKLLLDGMKFVGGTTLSIRDGLKPFMLTGAGRTSLIMPVRLPEKVIATVKGSREVAV